MRPLCSATLPDLQAHQGIGCRLNLPGRNPAAWSDAKEYEIGTNLEAKLIQTISVAAPLALVATPGTVGCWEPSLEQLTGLKLIASNATQREAMQIAKCFQFKSSRHAPDIPTSSTSFEIQPLQIHFWSLLAKRDSFITSGHQTRREHITDASGSRAE